MENQSNSIDVGQQNRLRIYCDKKAGQWLTGQSSVSEFFELTPKKSAQFSLNFKDSLILKKLDSSFEINLNPSIDELFLALKIMDKSEEEKLYNVSSITQKLTNESIKLFKQCQDLEDLILLLCTNKFFKGYDACQILLHEKGKPLAKSLSSFNKESVTSEDIEVAKYNAIFSKIKKSKNKLFDQSDLQAFEIKVIGSFLAKEIEFPSHTVIIILSRGDFFSPSEKEREYFDHFFTVAQDDVGKLISKSKSREKLIQFQEIIENFPFFISIKKNNNSIQSKHTRPKKILSKEFQDIQIELDTLEEFKSDPDYFHHERLLLMGELLNTLRHELSNPLFGINISTNLLLTDSFEKDREVIQTVEEIGKSSERCQKIIENFAGLYGDRNILQDTCIKELIDETLTLTKSESRQFRRLVEFDSATENLVIHTNPTLLSQIIFNLVINSSQALKESSQAEKEIKIQTTLENDELCIRVIDNGPGVPRNMIKKVFEAFYTTKDTGTGLGLAICQNLSKKISGNLSYEERKIGACFKLTMPLNVEKI